MAIWKKLVLTTGALATCGITGYLGARLAINRLSPTPLSLGVTDGRLAPCPDAPNCVSTQATDSEHRIEPISYTGTMEETRLRLIQIIDAIPNMQLATVSGPYLHAESRSRFWGFIDDTEFYIDDEAKVIHLRAASRLGREDFSVNRNRTIEIRDRFLALSLHERFVKNRTPS